MTPTSGLEAWLAEAARRRCGRHLERQRRPLRTLDAVRFHDGERELLNFSSNDYLGLTTHPEVAAALSAAAQEHGTGAGASALVTGYRGAHEALENDLAEFLERDRVLVCASGYMANLAVATSLTGRGDRIVQDRLAHASLIDAARLSGAQLSRYRHADLDSLERQLSLPCDGKRLVVTDGVFSMDGDVAPLAAIAGLAEQHDACLVVDDAHGIGALGPDGGGAAAAAGLDQNRVPVLVGTLGKAFGVSGAFVAGSEALISHLVNEARTYIFTTAMPPALAGAARASLAIIRREPWRREKLHETIKQFREGASRQGLPLMPSDSAIQPLVIGESEQAMRLSAALHERGLLVSAIRPPTVPEGSARLRITLSAAHERAQVEQLLDGLATCLDKL